MQPEYHRRTVNELSRALLISQEQIVMVKRFILKCGVKRMCLWIGGASLEAQTHMRNRFRYFHEAWIVTAVLIYIHTWFWAFAWEHFFSITCFAVLLIVYISLIFLVCIALVSSHRITCVLIFRCKCPCIDFFSCVLNENSNVKLINE